MLVHLFIYMLFIFQFVSPLPTCVTSVSGPPPVNSSAIPPYTGTSPSVSNYPLVSEFYISSIPLHHWCVCLNSSNCWYNSLGIIHLIHPLVPISNSLSPTAYASISTSVTAGEFQQLVCQFYFFQFKYRFVIFHF